MKALILNASPREGNTKAACEAFMKGCRDLECEMIYLNECSISPCQACDACGCESDCVYDDDTNMVVDKMLEADFILFATPVYWWGIAAQLKLAVDKIYSKGNIFKNVPKKIGLIAIGEDTLDGPQYELIGKQFECISEYLGWDMRFYIPVCAEGPMDLRNDALTVKKIEEAYQII